MILHCLWTLPFFFQQPLQPPNSIAVANQTISFFFFPWMRRHQSWSSWWILWAFWSLILLIVLRLLQGTVSSVPLLRNCSNGGFFQRLFLLREGGRCYSFLLLWLKCSLDKFLWSFSQLCSKEGTDFSLCIIAFFSLFYIMNKQWKIPTSRTTCWKVADVCQLLYRV